MGTSLIPFLHLEIIIQILFKLPPKSLCKFKCVSKSWLEQISSPDFVKTHLKLAAANDRHRSFLFQDKSKIKVCRLSALFFEATSDDSFPLFYKETSKDIIDMDSSVENFPTNSWTVDHANGLICLFGNMEEAFIWNPSIRKTKKVPRFEFIKWGITIYCQYGFGYDVTHDDYKVLIVQCIQSDGILGNPYDALIHIYSLRNDSWKTVEDDLPGYFVKNYSRRYLDGKIYWVSTASSVRVDMHNVCNIISFDLADEAWGKLELPKYGEANPDTHWILGVVGSDLSVLSACHGRTTFDVWTMKERGVDASWTKMFTIKYSQSLPESMEYILKKPFFTFSPFFCHSNDKGEILVLLPPIVIITNPKDGSTSQKVTALEQGLVKEVYVESLVDPMLIAGQGYQ